MSHALIEVDKLACHFDVSGGWLTRTLNRTGQGVVPKICGGLGIRSGSGK